MTTPKEWRKLITKGLINNYFEGAKYAIIRDEIKKMRPKKIEAEVKSNLDIVVTIGGADPNRRTIDAAKELLEMRSKIGAITFILGSLASNSIELELYSMQTDIEYKILRAPDNFATHLKDADIILCNGGTTLLESMHIGKPIVVYPQSVAEQSHAEYHAENHACVMSQRLVM